MDFCATICEIEVEVMWKFISYTIFTWIPVKTNRLLRNTDIPHAVLHLKHYYMIFDTKVFLCNQIQYNYTDVQWNDCFSTYFNELNYQSLRYKWTNFIQEFITKSVYILWKYSFIQTCLQFSIVLQSIMSYRILYVWMACNCCDYNWWEKGLTLLYFSWFNSNAIPFLVKTVNCQKDSQIVVSETNTKSYAKLQWVCI